MAFVLSLSKQERLFSTNVPKGSPFDKLRANALEKALS